MPHNTLGKYKGWFEDDGTYEILEQVLVKHGATDVGLIDRALDEITDYINFCMSITVKYWSNLDNEYVSYLKALKTEDGQIDYDDCIINEFYERRKYKLNDINCDRYNDPCCKMMRDEHRVKFGKDLTEEEIQRVDKFGYKYKYLFAKLLDGYSYRD